MKLLNRIAAASLVLCVVLSIVGLSVAQADTIGYWRFEDPNNIGKDSSSVGHDLVVENTVEAAGLGDSGPGSAFADPIPQTGDANTRAVSSFLEGSDRNRLHSPSNDADPAWGSGDFTIEAMLHYTNTNQGNYQTIVGRYMSSGGERSWYLRVNDNDEIALVYSDDGVDAKAVNSGLSLAEDKDYYVGMSYDSSANGVTFYVMNLTDEGELTSASEGNIGGIYDTPFGIEIGRLAACNSSTTFQSYIDEVRYSDTALTEEELLMVPEPATLSVVALGTAAILFRKNNRR